jgi:hypothetical protein
MSQPTQASLGKQFKIIMMSVKALAAGYIGWTIAISVIVGIVIGLVVLGWGIWPVKWTDAKPASLNPVYQEAFLQYAADANAAGYVQPSRVASMLEGWTKQDVLKKLDDLIAKNQPGQERLSKLRSDLDAYQGEFGPPQQAAQGGTSPLLIILLILLLVVLAVAGVWLVRRVLSERRAPPARVTGVAPTAEGEALVTKPVIVPPVSRAAGGARPMEKTAWAGETTAPLAQYVTTYALGDDRYDMSFSIETSTGDFLGECGVGISKTIGTGSPDKVTALEAWLFDKNDIRTITKVLMSEHAYNDPAIRAELAPKGDAILMKKGEVVTLLTQTLKVNVRIDDLAYGSGGLPSNSFFQQATIELAAWSNPV